MTDTPEAYRRRQYAKRQYTKQSSYGRPLYTAISGDSNACDDAYDRGWDVGRAAGWNSRAVSQWKATGMVFAIGLLTGGVIGYCMGAAR